MISSSIKSLWTFITLVALAFVIPTEAFALAVGDRVQCSDVGVKIRSTAVYDATNGNVIGSVSSPAPGTVLAGPTSNGGYTWWRVDWDGAGYPTGWSADLFLVKVAALAPDLLVTGAPSANPNPVTAGSAMAVSMTIKNQQWVPRRRCKSSRSARPRRPSRTPSPHPLLMPEHRPIRPIP